MHRRGGKRIRMDEPPPEYDNPMTPALESDAYGMHYGQSTSIYGDAYGDAGSSEQMFESPPTPGMRRVTRSKARGGGVSHQPVIIHSPTSPSPPRAGRGRPRGRPPGSKKHHVEGTHTDHDASLYQVIRSSKASLTNIVDDWIESYKVNFTKS